LRIERDDWLSSVLGRSSWKVSAVSASTPLAQIRVALLDRAGREPAFFSAKIPTSDVVAVTNATQAGLSVVDVNITFDWAGMSSGGIDDAKGQASDVAIETANPDDTAAIEQVAARCFTFSRFHLDPGIGVDRANEIKRQWAGNACRGRARAVYVARRPDGIAGFLAVLENRSDAGTDAIIDLVGVAGAHQGQGTGRALSRRFVDQWRGRVDRLRVGTQVSNIPAMRLYESLGFRVAETAYVLHAHVNQGAVAA
jgi:dTDP-4-amino-4,6-dideoxy-D-galactose acyltransferase